MFYHGIYEGGTCYSYDALVVLVVVVVVVVVVAVVVVGVESFC